MLLNSKDGLRVLRLTKSFGRTTAVDNVSFGIQRRGKIFVLLGPNGASKSTTISLICGDISPSSSSSSTPSDILVDICNTKGSLAGSRGLNPTLPCCIINCRACLAKLIGSAVPSWRNQRHFLLLYPQTSPLAPCEREMH